MPLPEALRARLQKRGLYKADKGEEVIAEDYSGDPLADDAVPDEEVEELFECDCPHSWNPHHACVNYCLEKWGPKKSTDDLQRLELEYELDFGDVPHPWERVWDDKWHSFYYWNPKSGKVAWRHPSDPEVVIDVPENGDANSDIADDHDDDDGEDGDFADDDDDDDGEGEDSEGDSNTGDNKTEGSHKELCLKCGVKDSEVNPRTKLCFTCSTTPSGASTRKRAVHFTGDDHSDPMDPAAYSDAPRGNWKRGLMKNLKTGVDSTAHGPLFQQRPYPSPGDVLRMNREKPMDAE